MLVAAILLLAQPDLPPGAVAKLGTVRMVHEDYVNTIAWGPGGTFASGGTDGTIRIWEASTGRETARFASPTREVRALAFSPDGATLVSGSYDGPIHVWDVKAKKEKATFAGHKGGVVTLSYSNDGTSILSGGADGMATVWDASTGAESQKLEGHRGDVRAWFAKDGRIATAGADGTVRTWEGGRERTKIGAGRIADVRFGAGDLFAEARTGEIVVTEAESGKERLRLAAREVRSFAFAPDGRALAAGDGAGVVRVRDMAREKERALMRPGGTITALAWSPDGWSLAVGTSGGSISLWDANGGARGHASGHAGAVVRVAWSPEGRSLVTGGEDGTVRLWDADGRQRLRLKETHERVNFVGFSPDGRSVITGDTHLGRVLDASTGDETRRFKPDQVMIASAGISGADRLLTVAYVAHEDGYWVNTVRVWEAATGRALRDFAFESDANEAPTAIAASADGSVIAVLGSDRLVVVIDGETGAVRHRLAVPSSVERLAVSPDGSWLATSSIVSRRGGTFIVWNARRGTEVARVQAHSRPLTSLSVSSDGQRVASASEGTVKLWELATMRELAAFSTRGWTVRHAAFAPDGRRLAVACEGGSAFVWDSAAPVETDADVLWKRLASSDAREADGAMGALAAAGDGSVAMLRERASTSTPDSDEVRALMRDLDGDDIELREKAAKRLEELEAEAPLREAKHAAAQAVLLALDRPQIRTADALRLTRAVQVLERIGTAAAREALRTLAEGRPMRASREARSALERLATARP